MNISQQLSKALKKSLFFGLFFVAALTLTVSDSQAQAEPSLLFSATSKIVRVGESFSVDVIVDTAGKSAHGTGAKISFDPEVLEVVSIQPGSIFGDYPVVSFDNATGKIIVSGISSSTRNEFKGRAVFATLTFRAKNKGGSSVQFAFEPGSTKDSNIAVTYGTGDILSRVDSLLVTVSSAADGLTPVTTTPVSQSETAKQDSQESLFTRLLRFLGLKKEPAVTRDGRQVSENIDERGPIPLQPPITDPGQEQPTAKILQPSARRPWLWLVVGVVITAVFGVGGFYYLQRARKRKETPPPVLPDEKA